MKELQGKVSILVKEKKDAVSQKTQVEEQFKIIAAQLKAKVETSIELCTFYSCM